MDANSVIEAGELREGSVGCWEVYAIALEAGIVLLRGVGMHAGRWELDTVDAVLALPRVLTARQVREAQASLRAKGLLPCR